MAYIWIKEPVNPSPTTDILKITLMFKLEAPSPLLMSKLEAKRKY